MDLTYQHQQETGDRFRHMDTTYLVEIRLSCTKWRIREIISSIAKKFAIEDLIEQHPHLTLFGPFTLNDGTTSRQVLDAVERVAGSYPPFRFLIDGWEKRQGMHGSVIAFPVRADEQLRKISEEISRVLSPLATSQNSWDGEPDGKWFHVTIANRLDDERASAVYSRLAAPAGDVADEQEKPEGIAGLLRRFRPSRVPEASSRISPPVLLDEAGIRITVMEGTNILAEYDLSEKQWIYRHCGHGTSRWQRSLAKYRHHAGLERDDPAYPSPDDIFVMADLHLGHANIIRYCSRPFLYPDADEMDHVLIKNWNYTVLPKTPVYHLGDLSYGKDAATVTQYRRKLRGDILFIRGSHDEEIPDAISSARLEYGGLQFFLTHDPADSPPSFDGWVIHGHHHNNDLRTYPFMNIAGRRINVSAEVAGYIPVSLRELAQRIRNREAAGDMSPVLLRYLEPC